MMQYNTGFLFTYLCQLLIIFIIRLRIYRMPLAFMMKRMSQSVINAQWEVIGFMAGLSCCLSCLVKGVTKQRFKLLGQ